MNKLLAKIVPFLLMGFILVVLVYGIIFLSYLFIIGAAVGGVLFVVAWIQNKLFFSAKKSTPQQKSGRIIEHDKKP